MSQTNKSCCKNYLMEGKYLTTSDYNKFKNEILDAKIKNKHLVNKSDASEITNNSDLDKKINH